MSSDIIFIHGGGLGGGREALCDLSMLTQVAIDESAPHLIKASIIYSYLATQRILRNSDN